MQNKIFSIIISSLLIFSASKLNAQELTKAQKLAEAVRHQKEVVPCHELGFNYYQGFPASVVGADKSDGVMTSEQYKQSFFKPISAQSYQESDKHYILPAYYRDYSDPNQKEREFVGFISYAVAKKVEPYQKYTKDKNGKDIPGKHYNFVKSPSSRRIPGGTQLKGLYVPAVMGMGAIGMPIMQSPAKAHYEICYAPKAWAAEGDFSELIAGLRNSYNNAGGNWFDLEIGMITRLFMSNPGSLPAGKYSYKEDEIPTLLGFWMHYGQWLQAGITRLNMTETGLLFVAYITPGIGSALAIKDVFTANEAATATDYALLISEAGLSAVSDALVFIKLAKSAVIAKEALQGISKTADGLDHIQILVTKGEVLLGGAYAAKGEPLQAFTSVAAGGADVFFTRYAKGNAGAEVTTGKLGKTAEPKSTCVKGQNDTVTVKDTDIQADTKPFVCENLSQGIASYSPSTKKYSFAARTKPALFPNLKLGEDMARFLSDTAAMVGVRSHEVMARLSRKGNFPDSIKNLPEADGVGKADFDLNKVKISVTYCDNETVIDLDAISELRYDQSVGDLYARAAQKQNFKISRISGGSSEMDPTDLIVAVHKPIFKYRGKLYSLADVNQISAIPDLKEDLSEILDMGAKAFIEENWHLTQHLLSGSYLPTRSASEMGEAIFDLIKNPNNQISDDIKTYFEKFSSTARKYNERPDSGNYTNAAQLIFANVLAELDFAVFMNQMSKFHSNPKIALTRHELVRYAGRPLAVQYDNLRAKGKPAGLNTLAEAARTAFDGW